MDASIVQAPITQANAREREALNKGEAPEGWSKRLAHTDRDARWTIKHGKSYYGYKLHGNVDARYKLIRQMKITAANADDGQQPPDVLQGRTRAIDCWLTGATTARPTGRCCSGTDWPTALRVAPSPADGQGSAQAAQQDDQPHAGAGRARLCGTEPTGRQARAGDDTGTQCAGTITLRCVAYNARRLVWLVKSAGASAQPA